MRPISNRSPRVPGVLANWFDENGTKSRTSPFGLPSKTDLVLLKVARWIPKATKCRNMDFRN